MLFRYRHALLDSRTGRTLVLIEAGVEQTVAVRIACGEVHRGSLR